MIKFLVLLLSFQINASIIKKGDAIVPFEIKDQSLINFLGEYANSMGVQINFTKDTIKLQDKVSLKINKTISLKDFREIIYTVLSTRGYTMDEDGKNYWVYSERDVRYMPSQIVYDQLDDINAKHVLYVHTLKYPIGNLIARNLRPFVSRYGRTIDIRNSNTLIVSDRKTNIVKIKTIIEQMDKKTAFDNYIASKIHEPTKRLGDYNELLEKYKILENLPPSKDFKEAKGEK